MCYLKCYATQIYVNARHARVVVWLSIAIWCEKNIFTDTTQAIAYFVAIRLVSSAYNYIYLLLIS